jgi:hypothetical protein
LMEQVLGHLVNLIIFGTSQVLGTVGSLLLVLLLVAL